MSDPIKQHTLPRFYIAGFHASRKPSHNPEVWYYPLEGPPPREWRLERAKDISVREDYYTVAGGPPESSRSLERLFGDLENAGAPALKNLANKRDPQGLADLALFIASLFARPPRIVEGYGRFTATLSGSPGTSYPDRARNRPNPGKTASNMLRESITQLVPRLSRMTWTVLQAPEEESLITSDSPLVVSFAGNGAQGLDDPGIELLLALNKNAVLSISRPGSGLQVVIGGIAPGGVDAFNARILHTARTGATFLISSRKLNPKELGGP